MSGEAKTSPRRAAWAVKRQQAIQLRISGATYQEIADEVGYYDRSTAYNAIADALTKIGRDEARQLRDLDLARLDTLQRALWPQAIAGELGCVDRILKIIAQRARICGYDGTDITITATAETTTTVDGTTVAELLGGTDEARRDMARVLHELLPRREVTT